MPYITQENYKKTTICFDFSEYSDCSSFTILPTFSVNYKHNSSRCRRCQGIDLLSLYGIYNPQLKVN